MAWAVARRGLLRVVWLLVWFLFVDFRFVSVEKSRVRSRRRSFSGEPEHLRTADVNIFQRLNEPDYRIGHRYPRLRVLFTVTGYLSWFEGKIAIF